MSAQLSPANSPLCFHGWLPGCTFAKVKRNADTSYKHVFFPRANGRGRKSRSWFDQIPGAYYNADKTAQLQGPGLRGLPAGLVASRRAGTCVRHQVSSQSFAAWLFFNSDLGSHRHSTCACQAWNVGHKERPSERKKKKKRKRKRET